MLQLPEGFNIALLFSDLFRVATPFVAIALLISSARLINKLCKRATP